MTGNGYRLSMFGAIAAAVLTVVASPFVLPPGVSLENPPLASKGWQGNGVLALSFLQAQKRLASSVAASGWRHLHTIELGRDRVLEAWSRGDEELTVMIWRIRPGESGFSYGVSRKSEAGDPRKAERIKGR